MSTHIDKILFRQTNFEGFRIFFARQKHQLTETKKCALEKLRTFIHQFFGYRWQQTLWP